MPFAKPSSIRALLLATLIGGVFFSAAGFALDEQRLLGGGLFLAAVSAGGITLHLIATERARHERVTEALAGQATFLESLVDSLSAIAATREPSEILEVARREAERLFGGRASLLAPKDEHGRAGRGNVAVLPLEAPAADVAALRLERDDTFARADAVRARVLADFTARVYDNARLLAEAQVREAERARLSDQLVTAEQDERRRLADFLHDTSVQELSGVALLLDATLHALEADQASEAAPILRRALERQRSTIASLRDLSFDLEPVVLRDQGFAPAVLALCQRLGLAHEIQIEPSVERAELLSDKAQAALYQFIRDALNQAVMRGPPRRAEVRVVDGADGAVEIVVADDGPREKRARTFEVLAERANALNGRFEVEQGEQGGTTVRVTLPAYVARG